MSTPLFDETVRSIQAAVGRARLAWITGLVITFVYGAGLYNEKLGYIDQLIQRRDLLARIVDQDLIKQSTAEIATRLSVKESELEFFDRARSGRGKELTYLRGYFQHPDSTMKRRTLAIIQSDRTELSKKYWEFNTISIPGTSIRATTSDLGIIGSLALLIVGFWLLANLLNEREALLRFLGAEMDQAGQWSINLRNSGFTSEDVSRAYQPISNAFVFAPSEKRLFIDLFNDVSFLAPAAIVTLTSIIDLVDTINKGLEHWLWPRWGAGVILTILVDYVWLRCLSLTNTTRQVLRLWTLRESETKGQKIG